MHGTNCCRIFHEMSFRFLLAGLCHGDFELTWVIFIFFWLQLCHRGLEFFFVTFWKELSSKRDLEFIFFIFWLRVTLSTSMLR